MAKTIEIGPYSAYAIAVANGYKGTEEEWLASLVGPRGAQGASITGVKIDGNEHIIVTIHDPVTNTDTTIDAGPIDNTSAVQSIQQAAQEALQQVAASTETAQTAATQAAESASNAAEAASTAAQSTASAAASAQTAKQAETAATQAARSAAADANAAAQSEASASKSASAAAGSATAANQSKTDAESAKTAAEAAKTAAQTAQSTAQASQAAAESAKTEAASSASAAADSATSAQTHATTAQQAAETATSAAETAAQDAADAVSEQLKEDVQGIVDNLDGLSEAIAIKETVTGEVISVSDSAVYKLQGLHLYGKSVQDGTPTPENPVEIQSLGDEGNVTTYIFGQNLIDPMDVEKWGTSNGATFDVLGNGKIEVTGTNGYSGITYMIPSDIINLLKDKNCVFSRTIDSSTNESGQIIVQIVVYALSGTKYYSAVNTPITIDADATGANFRLYVNNTSTALGTPNTVVFSNLGIYFGDTAQAWDTYEPMQTLTYPTPNGLPGIPVDSGGNYTDEDGQQWVCDEVDFGRGKYVQRIKKEYLTGTPNFNVSDAVDAERFWWDSCLTNTYKDGSNSSLSTFASYQFWSAGTSNHPIFAVSGKGVFFKPTASTTKEEINALFTQMIASENPPYIVGQLETPIETDLTSEQLTAYAALTTYKPNTTITTDSDPAVGASVDYVADTKTYIDNKIAAISEAILGGNT